MKIEYDPEIDALYILEREVRIFLKPYFTYTSVMKKATLEYDEQLFDQVRLELGTKGLKETVHKAFRELLRARAKSELLRWLRTGDDFDPPQVMDEIERQRRARKYPWPEPLDT